MDPCLLFLLNDSEFEAIQRNLEKEKSNQQNGIGTGPAASSADEEASALLEDILKDQDWRSLEPLLLDTFAKDPLAQTSRTIAMLALSKAHRRRNPEQAMKLAKEAYEMCSTEGIAYVAMAQARLSTQQVFEAQKWINLASSSNANGNFWFDTTQALVEQAVASSTSIGSSHPARRPFFPLRLVLLVWPYPNPFSPLHRNCTAQKASASAKRGTIV